MQIRQHNIYHKNLIVIKDVIISEKSRDKKEESVRKNIDKIMLVEVVRMFNLIHLNGKYI